MRLYQILYENNKNTFTSSQLLDLIINTYGHDNYHIIDDALHEYLPGHGYGEPPEDPRERIKVINQALREIGAKFKVGQITQKEINANDTDFDSDVHDEGETISIYHIIKTADSNMTGRGGNTPEQKAEVIRKSRASTNNMLKHGTPEAPPSAQVMPFRRST